MIYALYLNPTLDKTIYVENFTYGGTNRAQKSILQSGGKALNLAVVLHRLGTPVEVAGFLCREGCDAIERRLSDIPTSFVRLAGEPRTNLKIVDRAASVTTEVNDPAPPFPRSAGTAGGGAFGSPAAGGHARADRIPATRLPTRLLCAAHAAFSLPLCAGRLWRSAAPACGNAPTSSSRTLKSFRS